MTHGKGSVKSKANLLPQPGTKFEGETTDAATQSARPKRRYPAEVRVTYLERLPKEPGQGVIRWVLVFSGGPSS